MLDPNERLKRIWDKTTEYAIDHANKREEEAEILENESIDITSTDRHLFNFFYHDGYLDAINQMRYIMRLWDGDKEQWISPLEEV